MMRSSPPPHYFERLPKADLHCHLDGSLRLSTLNELAQKEHITIEPSLFGQVHVSLERFLERFSLICAVMQTEEAIRRVSFELVEDAAREGVWHLESRFCPLLLTNLGLSIEQVLLAAIEGGQAAAKQYGVSFGVIACGLRLYTPAQNLEIAKVAVRLKDKGIIGFDLAGPEAGYPAKHHAEAFLHVMRHYMNITVHAGEGYGPESIEQALYFCGAQRIGHGTRLYENPDLMRYVIDRQIPLEVCLTSNEQIGIVPSVAQHPLKAYVEAGVCVTLNTDNRLVSDTTLSREYQRAYEEAGLSLAQIEQVALNGFKNAFLPHRAKTELLTRVEAALGRP